MNMEDHRTNHLIEVNDDKLSPEFEQIHFQSRLEIARDQQNIQSGVLLRFEPSYIARDARNDFQWKVSQQHYVN